MKGLFPYIPNENYDIMTAITTVLHIYLFPTTEIHLKCPVLLAM